jgi:hypothetical protein
LQFSAKIGWAAGWLMESKQGRSAHRLPSKETKVQGGGKEGVRLTFNFVQL